MSISNEKARSGALANRYKTIILGAGITGLSAAWQLRSQEVAIVEATDRVGGWIQTHRQEGFLFERGPRSCKGSSQAVLELAKELGLEDELIWSDVKGRYLLEEGRLRPVPRAYLPLLAKALPRYLMTRRSTRDESIREYTTRRFGKQVAERLVDPLVAGIYAGSIDDLSMQSCFPKRAKGGKKGLFSFREGMETLPRALKSKLDCPILLNHEVKAIHLRDGGVEVVYNEGSLQCDQLISTLPPHALLRLLPDLSPLEEIPSLSLAVVHLGYRDKVLGQEGFGYLIPRREKEQILGCVFDSCVFPQQNSDERETRLSVMIEGEGKPFSEIALEAVHRHLGIYYTPDCLTVFPARRAIPQYRVGHAARVKELEMLSHPRLTLAGSGFYGVSVNDCIAKGQQAAYLFK